MLSLPQIALESGSVGSNISLFDLGLIQVELRYNTLIQARSNQSCRAGAVLDRLIGYLQPVLEPENSEISYRDLRLKREDDSTLHILSRKKPRFLSLGCSSQPSPYVQFPR